MSEVEGVWLLGAELGVYFLGGSQRMGDAVNG